MVSAFNPDKRMYSVDVLGKGPIFCKQITSGIIKPYTSGARVILGKFDNVDWTILGELPKAAAKLITEATSEEETLASGRGRLQDVAINVNDNLPSYRSIDSIGESETPVFTGDLRLENGAEKNVIKSFIQLYGFGDIILKSSSFCYFHLNKLRSKIILKARDLHISLAGYVFNVITPSNGDNANTTRTREEFRADPLQNQADIVVETGNLSGTGSNMALGSRTTFSSGAHELDLTTESTRLRQNQANFVLGGLQNSSETGDFAHKYGFEGVGASFQTSKGHITLLEADGRVILFVEDSNSTIELGDQGVTVSQAEQTFSLSPEGLRINTNKLDIDVSGDTTINSAGAMRLRGATIDLN